MPGRLIAATCQFHVDKDIRKNLSYNLMQMDIDHSRGADIVDFSECSLSGYAGMDFSHLRDQEEPLLQDALDLLLELL